MKTTTVPELKASLSKYLRSVYKERFSILPNHIG